jgi:hypothetical protein
VGDYEPIVRTRVMTVLGGRRTSRPPGGPPPAPLLGELDADAAQALVGTDDAVRTSDAELGFAVAGFGEQAAKPFSAALKAARAELAAAFRLRQLMDDKPESERQQRALLTEISTRCAEANRLLDEQAEAFDRLQDLEARAPRVLAEVDAHASQQTARLGQSRQILDQLASKYTPQAVAVAAAGPDQAARRLEFAAVWVTDARQALAADRAGQAAVSLQAAESAADQASDLLDGIKHLEAELTQAASALPAALREIDTDIAEATAVLAGRQPDNLAELVASAQQAAAMARGQLSGGPFDSVGMLRTLAEHDATLDHVLASGRQERDQRRRAGALLDHAMLIARTSITAAEDFISTRRGGVGARARTRLAEARRHYLEVVGLTSADPVSALAQAQRAGTLAQQARALAQQDVARFRDGQQAWVAGRDGFGAGIGGAILGGIVVPSPRVSSGQDGGLGPGSFGGADSRGRHSFGSRLEAAGPSSRGATLTVEVGQHG